MHGKYIIFLSYWLILLGASIWILGGQSGIIHVGNEIFFNSIFLAPILVISLIVSRKRAKKDNTSTISFRRQFFEKLATFLTVCSALSYLLIGVFVYQYAIYNPARLPIYKVETGDKTITFVSMVHIASPEFYQNVQDRVRTHLAKSGSVVYYEGVGSGTQSGNIRLQEILNTDLSKFYDEIAKKADLTSQSEQNTLTENDREHNVDMTSDKIVELYEERRRAKKNAATEDVPTLFSDTDIDDLGELLQTKNERERQLQVLLLRTLFSLSTRHQEVFSQEIIGGGDPFFDTILLDRNQYVFDAIQKRGDKDILVLYGSLHISGIIDLLRAKDPSLKQQFVESIPLF